MQNVLFSLNFESREMTQAIQKWSNVGMIWWKNTEKSAQFPQALSFPSLCVDRFVYLYKKMRDSFIFFDQKQNEGLGIGSILKTDGDSKQTNKINYFESECNFENNVLLCSQNQKVFL